jgi:CRISPR-associated endoribonuclease Cas6
VASDNDLETAIRAASIVISPKFENHSMDPGSGTNWTMRFGVLTLDELQHIRTFWPRVLAILHFAPEHLEQMRSVVYKWRYPGPIQRSPEVNEMMLTFAVEMLRGLVPVGMPLPCTLHWIRQISVDWELNLGIPVDPDFKILYPLKERMANLTWPRWTPYLCSKIATSVNDPSLWVNAILAQDAEADLVLPFLQQALELQNAGWEQLAFGCFHSEKAQRAVVHIALTSVLVPEVLKDAVFQIVEKYTGMIETLILSGQVNEKITLRLLRHENPALAIAAANGEWARDPQKQVADSLLEDWIQVVVNYIDDEYWLSDAFAQYPIAYDWLSARTQDDPTRLWKIHHDQIVTSAVNHLTIAERKLVLRNLPSSFYIASLVGYMVGNSLELYQDLLHLEHLKSYHLVPLMQYLDDVWVEKAKLAASSGYAPEQIAYAAFSYPPTEVVITEVLTTPGSHPWAGFAEKEQLLLRDELPERLTMEFASPTAFNLGTAPGSGASYALFPTPILVFDSLARKWREYVSAEIELGYVEDVASEVRVSDYRLQTQTLQWKGHVQKGFAGRCAYDLRNLAPDGRRLLTALADFAFYAGVGGKTTQGMGQTRRILDG